MSAHTWRAVLASVEAANKSHRHNACAEMPGVAQVLTLKGVLQAAAILACLLASLHLRLGCGARPLAAAHGRRTASEAVHQRQGAPEFSWVHVEVHGLQMFCGEGSLAATYSARWKDCTLFLLGVVWLDLYTTSALARCAGNSPCKRKEAAEPAVSAGQASGCYGKLSQKVSLQEVTTALLRLRASTALQARPSVQPPALPPAPPGDERPGKQAAPVRPHGLQRKFS